MTLCRNKAITFQTLRAQKRLKNCNSVWTLIQCSVRELPAALGAEAELGRLIEPMFPPRLLPDRPLDEVEEEDLPPSTESSSSKFLSARERYNFEPHLIKHFHCLQSICAFMRCIKMAIWRCSYMSWYISSRIIIKKKSHFLCMLNWLMRRNVVNMPHYFCFHSFLAVVIDDSFKQWQKFFIMSATPKSIGHAKCNRTEHYVCIPVFVTIKRLASLYIWSTIGLLLNKRRPIYGI